MKVGYLHLILILVAMFLIYYFLMNINREGFIFERYGQGWWNGWGRRRFPNRYRRPVIYENIYY